MTNISGYGYVRNGFTYDVPFIESILSVLPICDEFIAVVGDSTDGTREAIEGLCNPKIRIVDTVWRDEMTKEGKVFAEQSNIGLDHCTGSWIFHIQADEVVHENDLPVIVEYIKKYDTVPEVEGFILPFLHFWGDYRHIRNSRRVHRNEIRIFKNNKFIRAYRDSQGFRTYTSHEKYQRGSEKGKKLSVKLLPTPIFHYNAVRSSNNMVLKSNNFLYYYGETQNVLKKAPNSQFNYHTVDRVIKFNKTHPNVMQHAIENYGYQFEHDTSQAVWKMKDRIIQKFEDFLKIRFGEYKNYILLK